MTDADLTLRPRTGDIPTRCAYCHGPLAAAAPTWACDACGARLHSDCQQEAVHCPTPGCERSVWEVVRSPSQPAVAPVPEGQA